MRGKAAGFTLSELLVVIGIITVLAAFLFPVFRSAKHSALSTAGKSYMRDQMTLMTLYAQDADDRLPSYEVVRSNPTLQAPCSPADTWKQPCWFRESPMLGSFGYGPASFEQLPVEFSSMTEPRPLLADIFAAKYHVAEFAGSIPPDIPGCSQALTCEFPELIWFAYSDGSLRQQRNPTPPDKFTVGVRELFAWPSAFLREFKLQQQR